MKDLSLIMRISEDVLEIRTGAGEFIQVPGLNIEDHQAYIHINGIDAKKTLLKRAPRMIRSLKDPATSLLCGR